MHTIFSIPLSQATQHQTFATARCERTKPSGLNSNFRLRASYYYDKMPAWDNIQIRYDAELYPSLSPAAFPHTHNSPDAAQIEGFGSYVKNVETIDRELDKCFK